MRRVVVTGMGAISALGHDWESISARLKRVENAIERMDEWDEYEGLFTRLAGPIHDFEKPAHYGRKQVRTMGRIALMSTRATELALEDAGLLGDDILGSGDTGI